MTIGRFSLFALVLSTTAALAQTSWCGGANCRIGEPTAEAQREARDAFERRKRFEQRWGKNTDNYPDPILKQIERNPADPDCWQYTPKHC